MSEVTTKVIVLPGNSVVTDKTYLPGEDLVLSEKEANRLKGKKIVKLAGKGSASTKEKTTPTTLAPEVEVIGLIGKAQTLPELSKLIKSDKRQPVLDAFEARKKIIEERPAAKDVIKLIKAAKTVDEVNKIVGKDDRSGVAKEAEKKRKALTVDI